MLWPYGKNENGYGQLRVGVRQRRAHQYVCEKVHGEAPSGEYQVAHSCGNRACVNPRHLRWATPAENTADKVIHGTQQIGERNGQARLREFQVREILRLKGIQTQRAIAEKFCVSQFTIAQIHRRKAWAWVE